MTITFDQARREINRMKFVTGLTDIGEQMAHMGKMAKIVGVYRAALEIESRPSAGQKFLLPNIWELHRLGDTLADCPPFAELCEEITSWLGRKFPLLEEVTCSQWTDNCDDSALIQIANPGIDLCWDDAAELFECPENFSRDFGLMLLPIYAIFLGQFIGEDQEKPLFWNVAARWFGWDLEMPWWLWLPDHLWTTNNKKFYRLLEQANLPKVADTFRMAWHDTGTFFLDLEHQPDAYYGDDTMHELTVEKIGELAALWDEARPIHDRGYEACFEVFERPEMYKTIIELLGRCIVRGRDQKMSIGKLKAMAAEIKQNAAESPKGEEVENDDTT